MSHKPRNWRELYRLTGSLQDSPGLQNRLRSGHSFEGSTSYYHFNSKKTQILPLKRQIPPAYRWLSVTAQLVQEAAPSECLCFDQGCRLYRQDQALIPRNTTKIVISTAGSSDHGYVTGISSIADSGKVVGLGYTSEGNETVLQVPKLTGFTLAMGTGGLKA